MDILKEQFSKIYDEYIEKIYRFIYLKVNSQEIAEDITSRVFLKGWEIYQKDQKSIKNIKPFLYQVSRNMVIDHYREKGRTKVVSVDALPHAIDAGINLYEKIVFNADVALVKSAIQNLKKDYQDVLIWHYLEDMPTHEIAEILNKPEGTVRVMLHRGIKSLKNEFIKEA